MWFMVVQLTLIRLFRSTYEKRDNGCKKLSLADRAAAHHGRHITRRDRFSGAIFGH